MTKKGRIVLPQDAEMPEIKERPSSEFDSRGYLFIPGRVYSSKNSKRILAKQTVRSNWKCKINGTWKIVRPVISDSAAVARYKKENRAVFEALKSDFLYMAKGKAYPLRVVFVFVMPNKFRFDFNNMTEVIQDAMVDAGWLPDDSVDYMVPVPPASQIYFVDKENPGVYLKIL